MGTIAELLGYALTEDDASSQADASQLLQGVQEDSRNERRERAREAVMEAILFHTSLEPSDARDDLTLSGDLDLDRLSLYAVVSAIEHEMKVTFVDSEIDSWQTLGDLLAAAEGAAVKE
jgi:hypothetical protein